jgi:hypothetical protein
MGTGGVGHVGTGGARTVGGGGNAGANAAGAGGNAGASFASAGGNGANVAGAGGNTAASAAGAGGNAGASAAGAGGNAGASGSGGTDVPHGACLDGITDYENAGPFMFEAKTAGSVKLWVPMVPTGCKVPVIHMANGTGATCSAYQPSLERMASHGFLATCYEDPNTGTGDQGIKAFDAAFAMYPELADNKLGSTGHEAGGQGAFMVVQLAEEKWGGTRLYAGLAMEPASGFGTQPSSGGTWQEAYAKIKSPMFMFSALVTDGIVSQAWVQQAYDALSPTEEAYFWTADGAKHIPVPNGEEQEISIPWFRWKLLGDQKACAFFKAIPMTNKKWAEAASKNAQPCM